MNHQTLSQRYALRATESARNGNDAWADYYRHLATALKRVEQPERHLGRNRWRQSYARRVSPIATALRFVARVVESVQRRIAERRANRAAYRRYVALLCNES